MVKKTVTYNDFDGNERTEDFYFNLNEAELMDLRFSINGGLENILDGIVKANDQKLVMEYFKKIVLMAYGKKSPDGRTLTKNDAIREEFVSTMAYPKIFMELATDDKAAASFINQILPKNLEVKDHKVPTNALPQKKTAVDVIQPMK